MGKITQLTQPSKLIFRWLLAITFDRVVGFTWNWCQSIHLVILHLCINHRAGTGFQRTMVLDLHSWLNQSDFLISTKTYPHYHGVKSSNQWQIQNQGIELPLETFISQPFKLKPQPEGLKGTFISYIPDGTIEQWLRRSTPDHEVERSNPASDRQKFNFILGLGFQDANVPRSVSRHSMSVPTNLGYRVWPGLPPLRSSMPVCPFLKGVGGTFCSFFSFFSFF